MARASDADTGNGGLLEGGQVLELGYLGYKLDQFIGWDEWTPQARKTIVGAAPFVLGYPLAVGADYLVGLRYWDDPSPSATFYYTRSEILLLYQTAMDNYFYNLLGRYIGFNYAVNRGVYRIGVGNQAPPAGAQGGGLPGGLGGAGGAGGAKGAGGPAGGGKPRGSGSPPPGAKGAYPGKGGPPGKGAPRGKSPGPGKRK